MERRCDEAIEQWCGGVIDFANYTSQVTEQALDNKSYPGLLFYFLYYPKKSKLNYPLRFSNYYSNAPIRQIITC